MDQSEFKKSRSTNRRCLRVASLLETCPVGDCNPTDCQLFKVRLRPFQERLDWFRSLTQEQLNQIYKNHMQCEDVKLYLLEKANGVAV